MKMLPALYLQHIQVLLIPTQPLKIDTAQQRIYHQNRINAGSVSAKVDRLGKVPIVVLQ